MIIQAPRHRRLSLYFPLETNMPEIRVNIHTLDEMGSCYDWAAFRTEDVKEIVHRFFEGGKNLGATFVEVLDYTPDFHFLEDTRIDCVRLVVRCHNGEFWWEGYYRHCDVRFQTHRLQLKDLDITKDTDMRMNIETA